MKKIIIVLAVVLISLTGCGSKWKTFDYSNAEQKWAAEQIIKIPDDDVLEDYYECKVWATKRTFTIGGISLPVKQEYFEGFIAIPDFDDVYIFVYDLKYDSTSGTYSSCKLIDFNDTAYDAFKDYDGYMGHYRIDKIKIKVK